MTRLVLKSFAIALALLSVSFAASQVSAQSPSGISPDEFADAIPQVFSMEELAEQLQSPRSRQREQAARSLESMGAEAHKTLETIANEAKGDAPTRALQILERAYQSKDPKLSGSAAESLTRIAQGKGEHARAAANILSPPANQRQNDLPDGFPGQRVPRNVWSAVWPSKRGVHIDLSTNDQWGTRDYDSGKRSTIRFQRRGGRNRSSPAGRKGWCGDQGLQRRRCDEEARRRGASDV